MSNPVISVRSLQDERARIHLAIDDLIDTARAENRGLTAAERAEHDALVAQVDVFDGMIARSQGSYSGGLPVPGANTSRGGREIRRSLDELLWTTAEHVAGTTPGASVPVDRVAIRSEGGIPVFAPRIDAIAPDERHVVRSFQSTVADMILFGLLIDRSAKSSADGFEVARSHPAFADQWHYVLRAMDVDTSGEGGTWVPTGIGASWHEKVRAAGKVAPLFPRIDLPSNPWKFPIEGADVTAYRVAEPVGDTESKMTASTPGSVAATFDAEILGARSLFSRSLDADSAVAMLPFLSRKFIQAFVDAEERAILDGDTDGSHQDSDVGASTTDARTLWDGLRKRALAETTQALTATTVANLATVRKNMGKWGVNPSDLAFIIGVSSYGALLGDSNLLTNDKAGPNATILNGQVGSLFGVPVIVSEWVRENLNASGVYDGITQTKTYALCVNRNEWALGTRMALDVEVDDSIYRETYQRVMVAFERVDFQSIASASTDDNTSIAFNITTGS
jgi:HK97 family phage major capsid protein